jgi:hypothetical protein
MDESLKGMYCTLDRTRTKYDNIVQFVEYNGLDDMFQEMYARPVKDYIEIFGLAYHNGKIADEIILGLCEGGLCEPRKVKILPDYSLEVYW